MTNSGSVLNIIGEIASQIIYDSAQPVKTTVPEIFEDENDIKNRPQKIGYMN